MKSIVVTQYIENQPGSLWLLLSFMTIYLNSGFCVCVLFYWSLYLKTHNSFKPPPPTKEQHPGTDAQNASICCSDRCQTLLSFCQTRPFALIRSVAKRRHPARLGKQLNSRPNGISSTHSFLKWKHLC